MGEDLEIFVTLMWYFSDNWGMLGFAENEAGSKQICCVYLCIISFERDTLSVSSSQIPYYLRMSQHADVTIWQTSESSKMMMFVVWHFVSFSKVVLNMRNVK